MVMANADIRRMRSEGFREFRFVPITTGLPDPWSESSLLDQYRRMVATGVFCPGLHGFTHFSPEGMRCGWHDTGGFGQRTRALLKEDVPYLASVTPEFNFALVDRSNGTESYADATSQRGWVERGVALFCEAFGHPPVTTCAPGYRCNEVSFEAWADSGIQVVQRTGIGGIHDAGRMMVIERNVSFEPALQQGPVVENALERITRIVEAGLPAVICSHSINFISRHVGMRDHSLQCLERLLREVKRNFPDVRFAHDADVLTAYRSRDQHWFRAPRMRELLRRRRLRHSLFTERTE